MLVVEFQAKGGEGFAEAVIDGFDIFEWEFIAGSSHLMFSFTILTMNL